MAGDWIKIRPSLLTNPKVNGIARYLETSKEASNALTIGFDGVLKDIITRNVTRNVTVALLVTVWGAANEHTSDGIFRNAVLEDIDDMVGVPHFGKAMESVGWAFYDEENRCVILPNFNEHNTCGQDRSAEKNAERQRRYRQKKKENRNVTSNVTRNVTSNVTRNVTRNGREEKRKEDINPPCNPPQGDQPEKEKPSLSGKPDPAADLLAYLNEKTGKAFKPVDSNLRLIHARLKEGHSKEDIIGVIDRKVQGWANTDMAQYLRPETLFGATKFNQYVGELTVPVAATTEQEWHATWSGIVAKGEEHGLFEKDYPTPPDFKAAVFKAEGKPLTENRQGKKGKVMEFVQNKQEHP